MSSGLQNNNRFLLNVTFSVIFFKSLSPNCNVHFYTDEPILFAICSSQNLPALDLKSAFDALSESTQIQPRFTFG